MKGVRRLSGAPHCHTVLTTPFRDIARYVKVEGTAYVYAQASCSLPIEEPLLLTACWREVGIWTLSSRQRPKTSCVTDLHPASSTLKPQVARHIRGGICLQKGNGMPIATAQRTSQTTFCRFLKRGAASCVQLLGIFCGPIEHE